MKLKQYLIFCLYLNFCICDEFYNLIRLQWHEYKIKYGKSYTASIDDNYRFRIFIFKLKTIYLHNQRYEFGEESFKMGVNEFTDMLDNEIESSICGLNGTLFEKNWNTDENVVTYIPSDYENVPDKINWIEKGAVTNIKNQEKCKADWAFSTTGTLEGQQFRLTNKLISLSEQNLIDCSRDFGTKGCRYGTPKLAFSYLKNSTGIDTDNSYPYVGLDNQKCKFDKKNIGANCKGYAKVKRFDENILKSAVANIGPISIGVEATNNFFAYKDGVFYDDTCLKTTKNVNHAMLIVGYDTDEKTGLDYWLVKNSWGTKWGQNGYIKMSRNQNNNCNIASFPIYALV